MVTCPPASRLWRAGGADEQPSGGAVSGPPSPLVLFGRTQRTGSRASFRTMRLLRLMDWRIVRKLARPGSNKGLRRRALCVR